MRNTIWETMFFAGTLGQISMISPVSQVGEIGSDKGHRPEEVIEDEEEEEEEEREREPAVDRLAIPEKLLRITTAVVTLAIVLVFGAKFFAGLDVTGWLVSPLGPLHRVAALATIIGLVGRQAILSVASRSSDIRTVTSLLDIGAFFERLLVIPASTLVFVVGIALAWAGGWPVFGFLEGSSVNWLLASLVLSLAIAMLVIFIFLPRARVFSAALDDAIARGEVTDNLKAAFKDRAVRWAHVAEFVLVGIILYLMFAKPF